MDVNIVKYEGPKRVSNTGIRPLHMAAYGPMGGHAHIARMLLKAGAYVDAAMDSGRTALHIAAMRNGTKIADVLLEHGCSLEPISMENNEHKTPLMKAVDNGHLDMVGRLVDAGAAIDVQDIWGVTPLIAAIFSGKAHIAKWLIKQGCDINKASRSGMTPFQASLRHGPSMTRMLLEAGCLRGSPFDSLLENADTSVMPLEEKCYLMALLQMPTKLQQDCRLVIRKNISLRPINNISILPLPPRMKRYLHMEDLDMFVSSADYISRVTHSDVPSHLCTGLSVT